MRRRVMGQLCSVGWAWAVSFPQDRRTRDEVAKGTTGGEELLEGQHVLQPPGKPWFIFYIIHSPVSSIHSIPNGIPKAPWVAFIYLFIFVICTLPGVRSTQQGKVNKPSLVDSHLEQKAEVFVAAMHKVLWAFRKLRGAETYPERSHFKNSILESEDLMRRGNKKKTVLKKRVWQLWGQAECDIRRAQGGSGRKRSEPAAGSRCQIRKEPAFHTGEWELGGNHRALEATGR